MTTFYWWLGASLCAGIITIPSWKCMFRRQKFTWAEEGTTGVDVDEEEEKETNVGSGSGKKNKKKHA